MKQELLLSAISRKLDVLIALALKPSVQDMNLSEKIRLLSGLGLGNAEIAAVTGTTKGTVEVVKSRSKSRKD